MIQDDDVNNKGKIFKNKWREKRKSYFFLSYFWNISLWVHPNFKFGDSLDVKFNLASNPYPHYILLTYPQHQKMKISIKKTYFNIKICSFIEIFIFGCHGYLKSMQCGYGLDVELNIMHTTSPQTWNLG